MQPITQKKVAKQHQPKGGIEHIRRECSSIFAADVQETLVTTQWPKNPPSTLTKTEENLQAEWGKTMYRHDGNDCENALKIVEYVLGLSVS